MCRYLCGFADRVGCVSTQQADSSGGTLDVSALKLNILAPRISPETMGATPIYPKFPHHDNHDSNHNHSRDCNVNRD